MVERCEKEKNESDKCFKEMKVEMDEMKNELANQKKNNDESAKQCHFEGGEVMNRSNFDRMAIDNTRLETLFTEGLGEI